MRPPAALGIEGGRIERRPGLDAIGMGPRGSDDFQIVLMESRES